MADDEPTFPIDGPNGETQEIPLSELKFVSLKGNKLKVYLPEKVKTWTNPDGEEIGQKVGGGGIKFRNGIYPSEGQTMTEETAELLLEFGRYGEDYKVASAAFDTPTAEEIQEAKQQQAGEDEVVINGQVMKKDEALAMLAEDQDKGDPDVDETAPSEFESEATADQLNGQAHEAALQELNASNRGEALEMLASAGVPMENAPPSSATTSEIEEFAVSHGYTIPKYDLPDTE